MRILLKVVLHKTNSYFCNLQIVSVHSNSKFIHIGCDEVFTLRLCPRCIKNSESGDTLFLHHVATVAKIVHKHGKIPIMWDDMLRSISEV